MAEGAGGVGGLSSRDERRVVEIASRVMTMTRPGTNREVVGAVRWVVEAMRVNCRPFAEGVKRQGTRAGENLR